MAIVWSSNDVTLKLFRDGIQTASHSAEQLPNSILGRLVSGFFLGEANSETNVGRGEMDELLFFYQPKATEFIMALAGKYNGKYSL